MIKGRYVALLTIDIHIERKDVTFKEVEDSINGNFTEELRNAIADNFVANDVDITAEAGVAMVHIIRMIRDAMDDDKFIQHIIDFLLSRKRNWKDEYMGLSFIGNRLPDRFGNFH